MIDFKTVFSVSQFARLLSDHFRAEFDAIRIQGEVCAFTKASSGHWYLTLKDDSAQLKAVMFRPRNVLAGFLPAVGDKVEVLAQLAIYEPRGELQLIVDVIKKAGQGNLHEQYLQLKAKLFHEGLFDLARKKALPAAVFNLGVVTSLQAAALADVKQALARRAPHVHYTVYHTAVQGTQAAGQIIGALQKADLAGHDAIVLCRGGGSLEDLWCFNTETVVRAVAACTTPIVVGVGHESDVTLAELAADLRAATPTAAAELISKPTRELLDYVQGLQASLQRAWRHRVQSFVQQIDRAELGLVTPTAHLNSLELRLKHAVSRLPLVASRPVDQQQDLLARQCTHLKDRMLTAYTLATRHTQLASDALQAAQRNAVLNVESRVERLEAVLEAVSPQRTLERGYAFLQPAQGDSVIRSVQQVLPGERIRATLGDGEILMNVCEKTNEQRLANAEDTKSS